MRIQDLDGLTPQQQKRFMERRDVKVSTTYWDTPVEHPTMIIIEKVIEAMDPWFSATNLKGRGFVSTELEGRLDRQFPHLRHLEDPQEIVDSILAKSKLSGLLAVGCDKDPKRRIFMEPLGYTYRLANGFVHDEQFYTHIKLFGNSDVAEYKNRLMKLSLPADLQSRAGFVSDNVQCAYHNYKQKCLHVAEGHLTCEREHAHEREIISDCKSPLKKAFSTVAKGIRLAKILSKEPVWTLWNQSKVSHTIQTRLSQLEAHDAYRSACPCGTVKTQFDLHGKNRCCTIFQGSIAHQGTH